MATSPLPAQFRSVYESYLVPAGFAPFAGDMAARLAHRSVSSVLEIAAGTGVVDPMHLASAPCRRMSRLSRPDLNEAMLEHAQSVGNVPSGGVAAGGCRCATPSPTRRLMP